MICGLLALYDVDMIVIKRGQCVAWSYSDDAARLTVRTAKGEKHGCQHHIHDKANRLGRVFL